MWQHLDVSARIERLRGIIEGGQGSEGKPELPPKILSPPPICRVGFLDRLLVCSR